MNKNDYTSTELSSVIKIYDDGKTFIEFIFLEDATKFIECNKNKNKYKILPSIYSLHSDNNSPKKNRKQLCKVYKSKNGSVCDFLYHIPSELDLEALNQDFLFSYNEYYSLR